MKRLRRRISKLIHFMFDLCFVIFIVVFAYVFIMVYRGYVPNLFGYHILRVVSSSMEPVMYEGDCVISKSVDVYDIKEDDIITFYSEDPAIYNFLNTHRVVEVIENDDGTREFVTKGDDNPRPDSVTAKSSKIVGRYVGDVIYGKVITKGFDLLSNRIVYFILIVFPILVSFVSSIVSMVKIIAGLDDDGGSVVTGLDDFVGDDMPVSEEGVTDNNEDKAEDSN